MLTKQLKENTMNLQTEKQKFIKKLNNPKKEDIDNMSYQYSLFKANLIKFIPDISKENYKSFFIDMLYHKWLSGFEQYSIETLRNSKIINESSYNLNTNTQSKPLIFATFHLGSYRLFNSFLFENGFKMVLIIDETVYLTQHEDIMNNVKPLLKNNNDADFVILNVKDRTSIFKLKKLITEGYVMSVYLDGNTGLKRTLSNEFDKSFIPITFFNNTVYVKNGIGKLALLLGADIVPVLSHRNEKEQSIITFHKEISLSSFINKKDFPTKSIEIIYHIFEKKLNQYKTQWDNWIFIHSWFSRNYKTRYNMPNIIKNKFNDDRYSLFKIKDTHYLFDMFDYISYPIEFELYNNLEQNNLYNINLTLKTELINKNIII
jgi:lauroyl/myristoyl acyltransferase